jgi:hypothetical protein
MTATFHIIPGSLFTFLQLVLYSVSGDLMLQLQDLISDIIPSQTCHVNMGPILRAYGAMDIRNSGWFEPEREHLHSCVFRHKIIRWSSSLLFTLHSYTVFFMQPHTWESSRMRSGDNVGQSIGQGIAHSGTPLPVCWNVEVPLYARSTAVISFHVCSSHLEFLSCCTVSVEESDSCSYDIYDWEWPQEQDLEVLT